jgi:uncharacterized protein YdeI (YjbR/CyaY-like superfamily)
MNALAGQPVAEEAPAPRTFRSAAAFRSWLARSHRTSTELVVRCFKISASAQGISYTEALHEALCFGWIDGVRRSHDEASFTIRFTPRKRGSIWSLVNVAKAEMLIREGRMAPAGLAVFEAREESRTGIYSFERAAMTLALEYEQQFRAHPAAWEFFQARPPGYRRLCIYRVMSARRPETQLRRLAALIESSAAGRSIAELERPPKSGATTTKRKR